MLRFQRNEATSKELPRMSIRRAFSLLFALLGFGLGGSAFAFTFERQYAELESTLLQRLDFDGRELSAGPQTGWVVDRELSRCLREILCVHVSQYQPGEHIRMRMEERYDIGAVGGRSLEIDLRRLDSRRTEVKVDYLDRAVGFFLFPFAYVNPGWVREPRIAACLAKLEGAPKEIEKMPPPPPPPKPEQACEWTQGRSCGPPGAVLPCDTVGKYRLQCTCRGVWDCR
jgi:hypothetical protein